MSEHGEVPRNSRQPGSFWRTRAGMVLIGFAAIAGLLLAFEHRAHLLAGNGPLLILLALCVGAHFFMHGGHRGHGGGTRNGGGGDGP